MSSAIKMRRQAILKNVSLAETSVNLLIFAQPLHHYITSLVNSHLIEKVQSILPSLTQFSRMSQDHVFRIICSLMSSQISAKVFRFNDDWSMLWKCVFGSCCIKFEVLAEVLTNMIGNGFYKEAKNEYNTIWKQRHMTYVTIVLLEQISVSSVALCDYLSVLDDFNSNSLQLDHVTDMVLDQVKNTWQAVLTNESGPLDFIVPRILDIFIYKNEFDEALECLTSYKNLNPDNVHTYIYIYKFLVYCGTKTEETTQTIEECFQKVVQLSPCDPLILEMLDQCDIGSRYTCNILMEFVDYPSNKDNSESWKKLYKKLKKLSPEELETIQDHYESTYSSYWPEYHWKLSSESDSSSELKVWKDKVESQLDKQSSKNFLRSRSSSLSSNLTISSLSKAKRPKIESIY